MSTALADLPTASHLDRLDRKVARFSAVACYLHAEADRTRFLAQYGCLHPGRGFHDRAVLDTWAALDDAAQQAAGDARSALERAFV